MRPLLLVILLAAGACDSAPATPPPPPPPTDACADGESRCSGLQIERCVLGADGVRVWAAAVDCDGEMVCRDGACAPPTAKQLGQAETAAAYVDLLANESAWHLPVDWDLLKLDARRAILRGDGSDLTYFTALRAIHLAVPQGHQSLTLTSGSCRSTSIYAQDTSRFGVCGRPHGDGIIVTYARAGNPLGLRPGDVVVQAGADRGPALLEAAARRPVCGASSPSASHRRTSAAASFFGTVPAGMELTVAPAAGGPERTLVVPSTNGPVVSCQDPLGRAIDFEARAERRPDGVAVIRLPRFYPLAPVSQIDVNALIAQMTDAVRVEFDKVKDAPAIVWDLRANYGGITPVGLAIASGMPTARSTALSYCRYRPPGATTLDPQRYAEYAVTRTTTGPFAYAGRVAVVIDGLDYSASDYFAYAVRTATDTKLVGSATAGAYGGSGPREPLGGTPAVSVTVDVNRCFDAADLPLEGRAVEPHVPVEYDPADLAAGRDTLLEAAVALVR